MSLITFCHRRILSLQIGALAQEAGLNWRISQADPVAFRAQIKASPPRFALITHDHLTDPMLFTDIRANSPNTLIVVCLTAEVKTTPQLWQTLDNQEFDALCRFNELVDCLITLKAGRVYCSTLFKDRPDEQPDEPFPGWGTLSLTELRVLKAVAEGKTGPQIGYLLGISEKTVNNHKFSITQKLDLNGGGPGCLNRFALLNRDRLLHLLESIRYR
ncbi:helix-turn-helix domain-containing protein [Spirosoma montaniterrae]|uniref:HTH luxR-type domain-containing protein n=1 Tax=Spirosoma montaniterrae TaxID=1178516 RepID=A0A1P9WRC4_9BACT|nr:helix-turn-helix transcriptional regulator [Spirosoma montaniterrae]AQG77920.1 hypothetical protein AWR27_00250 [Spirosoma montaniterrae]